MLPSFSTEEQQGSRKTSVLISFGLHARPSPEGSRLVVVEVDVDHPLQLSESLPHLARARARAGGVHAPGEEPFELALIHLGEQGEPRRLHSLVQFRKPGIAEVVLLRRVVAIDGLEVAGDVFPPVAPPVDALRLFRRGRELPDIVLQVCKRGRRRGEVTGQDMEEDPVVRGALDVAFPPHGVHSAPGHPHVAEQELHDGEGPDVLHADRMLRPAHGVTDRGRPVRLARRADGLDRPLRACPSACR